MYFGISLIQIVCHDNVGMTVCVIMCKILFACVIFAPFKENKLGKSFRVWILPEIIRILPEMNLFSIRVTLHYSYAVKLVEDDNLHWACSFISGAVKEIWFNLPRCNCTGWLGVKHQITYCFQPSCSQSTMMVIPGWMFMWWLIILQGHRWNWNWKLHFSWQMLGQWSVTEMSSTVQQTHFSCM